MLAVFAEAASPAGLRIRSPFSSKPKGYNELHLYKYSQGSAVVELVI